MNQVSQNPTKRGSIRLTFLSLLVSGSVNSSLIRTAEAQDAQSATITLELLRNSSLRDPEQPRQSLGTLSAGSQITITLPAHSMAALNGRARISNGELNDMLDRVSTRGGRGSRVPALDRVGIVNVNSGSSVDPLTQQAYLDLRQLLKFDGVRLDEVKYNAPPVPPRIANSNRENRPIPDPRGTTSNVLTDAPLLATSRLQARADCVACSAIAPGGLSDRTSDLVGVQHSVQNSIADTQISRVEREAALATRDGSYSSRPDVQRLMRSAESRTGLRFNRRTRRYQGHKRSNVFTGRCWRYAKDAIYDAGFVTRDSLHSGRASDAVYELDRKYNDGIGRRGTMTNLLDLDSGLATHPERAPVGSILIYAGDRAHPNGDIQIRTENGYIADYFSQDSIINQHNGSHYHIVGVMVKP